MRGIRSLSGRVATVAWTVAWTVACVMAWGGCGGDDEPVPTGAGASDAGAATTADGSVPPGSEVDGGGSGGDAGSDRGMTDAGTGDVAPYDCEAEPGIDPGEPIEAPALEWTFVEFPDTSCMNGTSTGIGVNLNPDSDAVMIYLEGGGACFDRISCSFVAHRDGFDADTLASVTNGGRGIFDRNNSANPVRDWSFVFVPYCTGDVHAGNNPTGPEGRAHVGFTNVSAYLKRLVPTFGDAKRVLLTGSSAGGFGAAYNYDQVQRAFGCTEVTLLDDAGPPLADTYMKPCLQQLWRETWGLNATVPKDCTRCSQEDGGGIVNFARFLAEKYPARRFALMSSMEDSVIRNFFGYGYSSSCRSPSGMPGRDFRMGLEQFRGEVIADYDNFHTFYAEGDFHTFLGRAMHDDFGGVPLGTWIGALIEGSGEWGDVGP